MNLDAFVSTIQSTVPTGTVFESPGGGTSVVLAVSNTSISYRRGNSRISISFEALFKAYTKFKGQQVSSSDLKEYAPSTFDSHARPAGHSCNTTFFFLLLQRIGISGEIGGSGVKGNPYFIHIGPLQKVKE